MHLFQLLLVLERVHTRPESVVAEGTELVVLGEALERAGDKFFAVLDVVEYPLTENIEPAVDTDVGTTDNDLGRICDYSSIRVRLWETEVLPQLIHLVSHVEGTLRPEAGILEIFRALFPCGSITGAPKIRAMEILSEIEREPRGVSMGAIGIIRSTSGPDRCRMDFSVAIRTMIVEEGKALFNVGGGIVYDSDPAAEYARLC